MASMIVSLLFTALLFAAAASILFDLVRPLEGQDAPVVVHAAGERGSLLQLLELWLADRVSALLMPRPAAA